MGGKCVDGVALVSDSKVTYSDHPPSEVPKLHSEFYHIVTGGAGSTELYDAYRIHALNATQSGVTISTDFRLEQPTLHDTLPTVQTSGVIHVFSNEYNLFSLRNNFGNLVRGINRSEFAFSINGSLEVLVAVHVGDARRAELMHFTEAGPFAVHDYKGIGSSGMYTYVFLKPFFDSKSENTMQGFARIGYFIIRFIERFGLDHNVGGTPRIWFIPNSGEPLKDKTDPS